MMPLSLYLTRGMFFPWLIALGFMSGPVPVGIFSAGTEAVKDQRLGGMAMGVILLGQSIGMLLGPLVFGMIVASPGGWQAAFWSLAPVSALGAAVTLITKMK